MLAPAAAFDPWHPDLKDRQARMDGRVLPRAKPYKERLEPGLFLGWRKPVYGPGEWSAIVSIGKGKQKAEGIGTADDLGVKANGVTVLDYWQAARKARAKAVELANRDGLSATPATIAEALDAYADYLQAHGRARYNAKSPLAKSRKTGHSHMPAVLLAQRADQVRSKQLQRWRDGLVAKGMKRSSCNRMVTPLVAALNEAAKHDPRIAANAKAWTVGLAKLDDATTARKVILSVEQVRALVAAADAISKEFGLYVQMHAETGNRPSQLARLTVGDLELTDTGYRVIIQPSYKGEGGHKDEVPVPVSDGLGERLADAADGRPDDALLLLRANGRAWGKSDQRYPFERARKAAGLPKGVTLYWLRHWSVVRALRAGTPVNVVADWHSTGIKQLQTHYARFAKSTHDDLVRKAVIDFTPQVPQSNAA